MQLSPLIRLSTVQDNQVKRQVMSPIHSNADISGVVRFPGTAIGGTTPPVVLIA